MSWHFSGDTDNSTNPFLNMLDLMEPELPMVEQQQPAGQSAELAVAVVFTCQSFGRTCPPFGLLEWS
jgi:hypothetical protein